jgi:UDP-glucose 4-epimerase
LKALVTGASGFIGSNLVDKLLEDAVEVHGIDNYSTGNPKFIEKAKLKPNFIMFNFDLLKDDFSKLDNDYDIIFHLAANADIRGGVENNLIDIEQNLIVTHRLLEFTKIVKNIKDVTFCFASTAAALGEPSVFPTPENIEIPLQTSLYGASKLSCEAIISAYSNIFNIETYSFRFVSVLGLRYSHGHVFDFVKKLKQNPNRLDILGNGLAEKSYLNVKDCISALCLVCLEKRPSKNISHKFQVYNLGLDETILVKDSAKFISNCLNLKPEFIFGKNVRGWIGDNKFVHLCTKKIRALGWEPLHNIKPSIKETVNWLNENPEVLNYRD